LIQRTIFDNMSSIAFLLVIFRILCTIFYIFNIFKIVTHLLNNASVSPIHVFVKQSFLYIYCEISIALLFIDPLPISAKNTDVTYTSASQPF